MADVQPYLQRILDRFADPAVQGSMKGFSKSLLFKFTDIGQEWQMRFAGNTATFAQETLDKPDVTVTTTSELLAGIMDRKTNAMAAYMQRKIQVKGAMEDLMKLQKLML